MDSRPAKDNLRMYVNDMLAVERDLTHAVTGQTEDANVKADPEIHALLTEVLADSIARADRMKALSTALDGQVGAMVKEAVASAAGTLAGWYGMVRKHPVSRMLRDDHVALNVAALSYGMLYTSALAYDDQEVAAVALTHLQDLPAQIMKVGRLIPEAVVKELAADFPAAQSAIDTARRDIESSWTNANFEQAA